MASNNYRQIAYKRLVGFYHNPGKINFQVIFLEAGARASDLVRTVIANRNYLDLLISCYSSRPLQKLNRHLYVVLQIGLAELFLLGQPEYAAVSEAVDLLKGQLKPLKSFANAVFRESQRRNTAEFADPRDAPIKHLVQKYSHPDFLIERWHKRFGFDKTLSICVANNQHKTITLRTNLRLTRREQLVQRLQAVCDKVTSSKITKEAIYVDGFPGLSHPKIASAWQNGFFYIQNEAAQLTAIFANPTKGEMIIDLCSGPGGKTTHLAELTDDQATIHSVESSAQKAKKVTENCERLQLKSVNVHIDSLFSENVKKLIGDAKLILVDPPCSGLGIIAKAPERRWLVTQADIDRLAKQQLEMLCHIYEHMSPGSRLVYSVCSISQEETFDVVKLAQQHCPGLVAETLKLTELGEPASQPCFLSLPGEHHFDGMFVAKWHKQ